VSGDVDPEDERAAPGASAAEVAATLKRQSRDTVALEPTGAERGEGAGPLLQAGEMLAGRFTVLRFVARGGMGSVYEATDVMLRTRVALKVLEGRITADPAAMERFRREVLLARRVSHPNVCRVYELYQATTASGAPVHFLTMEFLEGETLAARLARDGKLTTAEALPLVQQMGEGLAAAHAEGVVHRDFKSGNVMLVPRAGEAGTGGMRVAITDFGIARAFEQGRGPEALTGGGAILGTPEYMAPEQVTGSDVSPATDVYALGVVMYQMVTGRLPFTGDTPLATAARRIDAPPPRPELAAPGLDPRWSRTILRCLDRDPRRRFPHAPDVAAALADRRPRRWPVALGVAVAALVALAVGVGVRLGRGRAPEPAPQSRPPSIAVLPFVDMSPGHDQEYFSDGVAQEILNALAQVPGLHVVARSSSFAFKGKSEDLRTVGQKLEVASILEGSVQKAGSRLRVTAQLVNVADGYQLWSQTFDRDVADVFAVQDEISRAVVGALRMKVLPGSGGGAPEPRATRPEAYAAYLRGLQLENTGSFEILPEAMAEFRKAIALDADWAPAHAALAETLLAYGGNADSVALQRLGGDWRRDAMAEIDRALRLDPRSPEAWIARGLAHSYVSWDWTAALADYEQALALAPANAAAVEGYADVLAILGRLPESVAAAKRAAALDPLSAPAFYRLGFLLTRAEQYGAARAALQNAIALAPQHIFRRYLGYLEVLDGHPDTALAIFRDHPLEWTRLFGTALAQHSLGNDAASRQALDELIARHSTDSAYQVASAFAWRGDRDQAFQWLERAYQIRDPGIPYITIDPFTRSMRGDPRFRAFLAKLGLPPD